MSGGLTTSEIDRLLSVFVVGEKKIQSAVCEFSIFFLSYNNFTRLKTARTRENSFLNFANECRF